jgi:hypothetical protein
MAKGALGAIAGLAVWVAVATAAGLAMRASWPEYASVAEAMTFTLPMMIARLAIGAIATVATGRVTASITRSTLARWLPGVLLLTAFIPQHIALWQKFPVWYHLTFLASLIPLNLAGATIGADRRTA